jgi:hypothetical protein
MNAMSGMSSSVTIASALSSVRFTTTGVMTTSL